MNKFIPLLVIAVAFVAMASEPASSTPLKDLPHVAAASLPNVLHSTSIVSDAFAEADVDRLMGEVASYERPKNLSLGYADENGYSHAYYGDGRGGLWNESLPERYPYRSYQGPMGTNYVLGQPVRNAGRLLGTIARNWPGPIATWWRWRRGCC